MSRIRASDHQRNAPADAGGAGGTAALAVGGDARGPDDRPVESTEQQHPDHAEPEGSAGKHLRGFEKIAPAIIFALITVFLALDLADDIVNHESVRHLTVMGFGIVLSLGGLVLMIRWLRASRARALELATALDHSRVDSMRWRERASQVLQGLGNLINQQFAEWNLSPSEREVGMLLLKGLSLREIASIRHASEATVRQQAQAIYRKADLGGRAELSAFFLEDLLLPRGTAGDPDAASARAAHEDPERR